MEAPFQHFIDQNQLLSPTSKVLLGFSGGVDSVVLAHLLLNQGYCIQLAHVNYGLRGAESDADAAFCWEFSQQYQLILHAKTIDPATTFSPSGSAIQQTAREIRYRFFQDILSQQAVLGNHLVLATAHHATDQAETILLNLFRGTGIKGLRGMLPLRNSHIRPLLFATKQQIIQYANQHNLAYVEDSSNAGDKYVRNKIRHNILPVAETVFPQAVSNIWHTSQRIAEVESILEQFVESKRAAIFEPDGEGFRLPLQKLKALKPQITLVLALFQKFGLTEAQVPELQKLYDAQNGSVLNLGAWQIIRHQKWLLLAPLRAVGEPAWAVINDFGTYAIGPGKLHIKGPEPANLQQSLTNNDQVVWIDAADLQFPLVARPYKAGDYFYPLGMTKKKKLARLFIDLKLSKIEKEKIWVLESNKKICWVIGFRLDNRFKLSNKTPQMVQVSLIPTKN